MRRKLIGQSQWPAQLAYNVVLCGATELNTSRNCQLVVFDRPAANPGREFVTMFRLIKTESVLHHCSFVGFYYL